MVDVVAETINDEITPRAQTTAALRDMFGRGLVFAAVLALQSIVMIVVTPLTVRDLSKPGFGHLVTAFTLIQLLVMVLGFGLGAAVQRLHAEDDGERHRTRGLLGCSLALTLVATVLVDLTGHQWAGLLGLGPYGTTLRLSVWAAGLAALVTLMASYFRSEDRLGAFSAVMLPFAVGSQLAGLAGITWLQPTAAHYLAGMCVGEGVAVAIGLALSRPRLLWWADRRLVGAGLALTLPLVPNGIAYQTLNMGDRIVVQHQLGEFAVGRYQLAYNAAAIVILVLTLLNQAWLPKIFAMRDPFLRRHLLGQLRDEVYRLLAPLVIGICLVAPLVLRVLAPPSYQTQSLLLVVSLVAVSAIPFAAFQANTRTLTVFGRTGSLIWAAPVAAALNIGLNLALVPVWGLDASALATLIGYGVLALITGFSARRVGHLEPSPTSVWMVVTATTGAALLTAALPTSTIFIGLRLVLAVVCAVRATMRVVALVRGRPRPERRRPKHAAPRRRPVQRPPTRASRPSAPAGIAPAVAAD
jgi:O-antigen/teichoic acid export membrane protein